MGALIASGLWHGLLTAVSGAAAASLVGIIVTGGRLRKLWTKAKSCAECVWEHTNTVVYIALLVFVAAFFWEFRRVDEEASQTRAALCFFRSDLQDRIDQNEFKIRHARQLGLPPSAVNQIQVMLVAQRVTLLTLQRLKC